MSLVLMITGPAGAGKSTTSAAWADRGETPRAFIDADALRTDIRAGCADVARVRARRCVESDHAVRCVFIRPIR